ncbi:MAG: chemotaxis protein CheW [Polyangiaceae bacterium]|nr:chemotaxis protein CheW [Polyangiaceae bacterium]
MADVVRRVRSRGRLAPSPGSRDFLVFTLASEPYAVALEDIREILGPPPITFVPRAPREIVGVCSVRGMLVTVIDLRRLLSLEEAAIGRRTRILLSAVLEEETVGLMVDEVKNVVRLSEAQIEVAGSVLGGDVSEHVAAIGRPDPDTVIVVLDVASVVGGKAEVHKW